jgi:hypothetical protein
MIEKVLHTVLYLRRTKMDLNKIKKGKPARRLPQVLSLTGPAFLVVCGECAVFIAHVEGPQDRTKNLAREYALHFTNSGRRGASKKRSQSSNHAHPHIVKGTVSSGAVVASAVLNGNGNGHAPFDEEEKSRSHRRGFFADQFEVSEPVEPSMCTWHEIFCRTAATLMRISLAPVLKFGDRRTAKSPVSSRVPVSLLRSPLSGHSLMLNSWKGLAVQLQAQVNFSSLWRMTFS